MSNQLIEFGVIGNFLTEKLSADKVFEIARHYGLTSSHFSDPECRAAYEMIEKEASKDSSWLGQMLVERKGCSWVDKAIANAAQHPVAIDKQIRTLVQDSVLTRLIDDAVQAQKTGDTTELLKNGPRIFNDLQGGIVNALCCKGKTLADIVEQPPEEKNPSALIRGGWLRKGHGSILASVTGSGKSVLSIQLAMSWAVGKGLFSIEPVRPLRIGIFETEDDEEELADFLKSMRRGFTEICGWDKKMLAAAERNVVFHDTQGKSGREFAELLRQVQRQNHYDLVIVNPLQAVTGCDIAKNDEMSDFLRQQLDSVIKNPETECGLLIIHHANKPTMVNGRRGYGGDEYSEYLGAGAAELPNWARGVMVILPMDQRRYRLIAAKRGDRLGWPAPVGIKASKPTKIICHAPPESNMMFWLEEEAPAVAAKEAKADTLEEDVKLLAASLKEVPRTSTDAREHAMKMFGQSRRRANLVYDHLTKNLGKYGLASAGSGLGNQKVIGTKEGCRNLILQKRDKFIQDKPIKFDKK